jgi:heme/copper-type cytochrome/quinol oxidase subunit 2
MDRSGLIYFTKTETVRAFVYAHGNDKISTMIILIAIILLIVLGIYYIGTLDFEVGTGYTEEKNQAREVEYTVTKKGEADDTKLIE